MKEYVLNKDEKSIGFGWWVVLLALPIFFTTIWGMSSEYEKLGKAVPGLFALFGVFLLGIFGPLNKKMKPSRNRNLAFDVLKIQVIAGVMPIATSITEQVPFESIGMLYLGTLVVMLFAVGYMVFADKKSN
jgi:hypothetical protein